MSEPICIYRANKSVDYCHKENCPMGKKASPELGNCEYRKEFTNQATVWLLDKTLQQIIKEFYELKDEIMQLKGAMALHQVNEVLPKESSKEYCGNCKFFSPGIEEADSCRRHPPIVLGDSLTYESYFPDVDSNAWCGEWVSK